MCVQLLRKLTERIADSRLYDLEGIVDNRSPTRSGNDPAAKTTIP